MHEHGCRSDWISLEGWYHLRLKVDQKASDFDQTVLSANEVDSVPALSTKIFSTRVSGPTPVDEVLLGK